jgi:hypothetical protein
MFYQCATARLKHNHTDPHRDLIPSLCDRRIAGFDVCEVTFPQLKARVKKQKALVGWARGHVSLSCAQLAPSVAILLRSESLYCIWFKDGAVLSRTVYTDIGPE